MKSVRRRARCVLAAGAVLFGAPAVGAQAWVQFPSGGLGYITDYTTTGFVHCGDRADSFGTCNAGPNTSLVAATSLAMAVGQSLSWLSTPTETANASAASQPTTNSLNGSYNFSMNLSTATQLQMPQVRNASSIPPWMNVASQHFLRDWDDYLAAMAEANRQAAGNDDTDDVLPGPVGPGVVEEPPVVKPNDVVTNPNVVPEPATVWLMATGMFALTAMMWWRRKEHMS